MPKNCAQGRRTALRGSRRRSRRLQYAALVASPRALPDNLIPVFQLPGKKEIAWKFCRKPKMPDSNVHFIKQIALGCQRVFTRKAIGMQRPAGAVV
jgi:hypothetical protein